MYSVLVDHLRHKCYAKNDTAQLELFQGLSYASPLGIKIKDTEDISIH